MRLSRVVIRHSILFRLRRPVARLLAAGIVSSLAWAVDPLVVHVAPGGRDSWGGLRAAPKADQSDGPLASLTAARDLVRKKRAEAGGLALAATIRVHDGTYRLDSPFLLEPRDSGTAAAPFVIEAAPGAKPVFSGGGRITGFEKHGERWEATLPEVRSGRWYFRELFVNGQRRQRARSPDHGYHRIAALLPGPADPRAQPVARDRFVFAPGDLKPFDRLGDVNVILMHSWENSIHPVKSVDATSRIVEFTAPMSEWWSIGYWEASQRYFVENALELLDAPGEWYLNRETGLLSYLPMPGERIDQAEVVAPVLDELVVIAGNADGGRFVEHVTLRGLAFHHADWPLSPGGNSSTQAAVNVPAVLMADGARHVAIERCEVAHTGTYGIWFRRGCHDCRLQQNRLFDLGAGGLRVGEAGRAATDEAETTATLLDNNHIFSGGHIYPGAVGIWVAQSSRNTISHNDIHDLLYSGISIGWNWGLEPNRTHHNLVEWNHIHDLVHGTLSDAGLIYCLGVSPGSIIRHNLLHDLWPYDQPALGWGIYLDAQCGGYTVENNLVYNTLNGGLMFNNGGHAHTIRNNIFALSARQALWPYSEKSPSTFRRNIVFLTQGDLFIPNGEHSLEERLAAGEPPGDWDENLYWHTDGPEALRFYRRRFGDWQALGLDVHSRVADPRFADVEKRDFRLAADSPARALGFRSFDLTEAGLYGDQAWKNEARHGKCVISPLPPPPPPPPPLALDDGFETTPAGASPARAIVSGAENGAAIAVSAERAATGKQSLKITDSKALEPTWQPHFYYEPHWKSGVARFSFDVFAEPGSRFACEWRDAGPYPRNVGPSVTFDADGPITAAGREVGLLPARGWTHVEIECPLGRVEHRAWKITITPAGQAPVVASDLPVTAPDFAELHWLGFPSLAAADTAFFLDNVRLAQPGGR